MAMNRESIDAQLVTDLARKVSDRVELEIGRTIALLDSVSDRQMFALVCIALIAKHADALVDYSTAPTPVKKGMSRMVRAMVVGRALEAALTSKGDPRHIERYMMAPDDD